MIGSTPQHVYGELHADKAFIRIDGIEPAVGLTAFNLEDAQTQRRLIQSARDKIVVVQGGPSGLTTFASATSLKYIDTIFSDRSASVEMIDKIRTSGVEVVITD